MTHKALIRRLQISCFGLDAVDPLRLLVDDVVEALEQPQRTERPVDCERCNRLEEQAYDLVGKLRVANIKLSMQPQRTWVGLTDEEIKPCWHEACQTNLELTSQLVVYFAKAIEAKLKEKNA